MIGIYKITNPKGKIYIGQSTNIHKRWKKAYKTLQCRGQVRLYRSLVKYGYSEHIFEVIEECSVEELNTRERYWQDFYHVLEEGLNCKLTGTDDKSGYTSEDSRQKMVITRTGQKRGPQTVEHVAKRVASFKGKTYEEIYGIEKAEELKKNKRDRMTGVSRGPHSEEHIANIKASRKGKGNFREGTTHTEETKAKMRKPKDKVECPHCNKIGGNSQMKRWHFENCRHR